MPTLLHTVTRSVDMTESTMPKAGAAISKRQKTTACLLGLLLCLVAFPLYSCALSEEEIIERNIATIKKHLDIDDKNAWRAAGAMHLTSIGEIKELTVETKHNYGTSFFVTDHLGYTYYMTLNRFDSPGMIFEEPSGRILYDTEHGVVRKRGEE
jgi:hypothetical protein